MGRLFGTDGIRGVANQFPMNMETACEVGKAVASYFIGSKDPKRHIVIGQDTRLSGDMLAQSVAAGACAAGGDVALLGVLPTPGIAHLATASGAAAGIVISASHNPYEDNGIKVFDAGGYKLSEAAEQHLETLVLGKERVSLAGPVNIGRLRPLDDPCAQYLAFLQGAAGQLALDTLSIVLDCANGATYQVAPALFEQLGARVTALFCDPDGRNINDGCGSQHPHMLSRMVVASGADIGLAFDGDGDRLIAVDEKGNVLSGDQVLAICAADLKKKGRLKNDLVVSTVMSNMGLGIALQNIGARLATTQVGDRYVMEKMRSEGAILGGEDSGHMIFLDAHTTGDGLVAALRLLDAMQAANQPLSELAGIMTVFPQELLNVPVTSKPPIEGLTQVVRAIETVEKELGDRGRVLVRYSGTQQMCRVMVEGPTKRQTEAACQKIAHAVRASIG